MSLESSQKAKSARLLSSSCSRFLPCSCVGPEVSSASPRLLGSHHHGGTSRYCLYTALQLVFVTHSSSPGLSSTWTMAGRQAGRQAAVVVSYRHPVASACMAGFPSAPGLLHTTGTWEHVVSVATLLLSPLPGESTSHVPSTYTARNLLPSVAAWLPHRNQARYLCHASSLVFVTCLNLEMCRNMTSQSGV